jgi:prepilin peptidase CpaA
MDIFATILKATVLVLVLIAAYEDFRHLRIRNDICLGVAILFIPFACTLSWHDISMHLLSGVIVLAVTALMFFTRLLGGGDAKLMASLALWLQPSQLIEFVMIMSLAGGVIAGIAVLLKRTNILTRMPAILGPDDGWLASLNRGETVVPYGIAIAIATALTLFSKGIS